MPPYTTTAAQRYGGMGAVPQRAAHLYVAASGRSFAISVYDFAGKTGVFVWPQNDIAALQNSLANTRTYS